MKIVIGCSSRIDHGSGILAYCKNLSSYLAKKGHDVYLIYLKSDDVSWLAKNNVNGVSVTVGEPPKLEVAQLNKRITEIAPDLVINNDNSFLQQLAPAISCPFFFVLHLGNYSILSLAKINQEYVDRYIATTSDMKFDLAKIGIPTNKISVVLNGLNAPFSYKKKKTDKCRVLFAGEPTRRKGADKFIKLINNYSMPNVEFHWTVGDKIDAIRSKITAKNEVVLHRRLPSDEFHSLMDSSNVFVMPSRDEGLPIALLEAIGYGLIPIVTNGKGAMKEVVEHGVNGFVCELNSWEIETFSILKDLKPTDIEFLSDKAIATFNKQYASAEYANKLIELCEGLKCTHKEKQKLITIYQWHRPSVVGVSLFTGFLNRIKVKLGIIPKIGRLKL